MSWGQGQKAIIERYHAIRTNAAILGIAIPIVFGQNRLTSKLVWYSDFKAAKSKVPGGKGWGKGGSQYVYTASIMMVLAMGPIKALLSVWDSSTGKFVVESATETYVVTAPYHYTPNNVSAFNVDLVPSLVTAYSYAGVNDYGSPGPVTLSGSTNVPLVPAAPVFIKVTSQTQNVPLPTTVTFVGGNTTGNTIVVCVLETATTTEHVTGITDTEGNTYTKAAGATQLDNNNNGYYSIWTAPVTGGSGSDNILTIAGSGNAVCCGLEYFGIVTASSPLDASAGANNNGTTSLKYTITTVGKNDLIVSMTAYQGGGNTWSGLSGNLRNGNGTVLAIFDKVAPVGVNTITQTNGYLLAAPAGFSVALLATGVPATGQYSIDPITNIYTFATADTGKTVIVNYAFDRYTFTTDELAIIPFSPGPYRVVVQNNSVYRFDRGVKFYPSGVALTLVSSSPTTGQYSHSGGTYSFAAADQGLGIVISYEYKDPNVADVNAPSDLNLTLIGGSKFQAPWSYLTSNHASQALGYSQLAMIASSALFLGYSPTLPNYTYEVAGAYQVGGGVVDANPADCITAVLSDPAYGIGFPLENIGDLTLARACWTANSFFISPLLENQSSAASVVGEWLKAGMVAAYWSEGLLKFVPYCDTSAVGNGVLYQPSTSPVISINLDDMKFVSEGRSNENPVKITRTPWMDAYNRVQVVYSARVNEYNPELMYEEDTGSIKRYGLRIQDPYRWDFITTLAAAQYAASMWLQRNVFVRNTYEFMLPHSFSYLEPMDVVPITDSVMGLNGTPVRIQKIVDDPGKALMITAEDFIWGTASPAYNPKQMNAPPPPLPSQADPGNTTALIFEAPSARLGLQQGNMLYGFVNGADSNWGGCHVWISFDGTNYELMPGLPNGAVNQPARIGNLTANLAPYSGANPDNTNLLSVQMLDNTPLSSTTMAGAQANVSLCAIVTNTSSVGLSLELVSYVTATLSGSNSYNITGLYRGIYGTQPIAHLAGDQFCRLDQASFQMQYDPTYVGKTMYVKFTSFNLVGGNEQSLANVQAYAFTLQGTTGALALDTGYLNIVAPGYAVYRPLTNPLTAHDAGASATINIAPFTLRLSGHADIGYNSGAITGLLYSTLYYIYLDDQLEVGGTVAYHATSIKEDNFIGLNRFFVGSINTPQAGGSDTTGNNDGGVGAQNGITFNYLYTTLNQNGTGVTNLNNCIDGDYSTKATFTSAWNQSSSGVLISGATSFLTRYSSVTVEVDYQILTNTLNNGGTVAAFIQVEVPRGTSTQVFIASGQTVARRTAVFQIFPATAPNIDPWTQISSVNVRLGTNTLFISPAPTSGQIIMDVFDVRIKAVQ